MSKPRRSELTHDDGGGNAMTTAVGRYTVWDSRPRVRREIHDGEAAAGLERSQQARIDALRIGQMVVHVAQEDRVTAFIGQVGRSRASLEYDNIGQGIAL